MVSFSSTCLPLNGATVLASARGFYSLQLQVTSEEIVALQEIKEVTPLLRSRADAARMLGISTRKLDYLIAAKRLQVRRIDGRVMVSQRVLEKFAEGK